MVSRLEKMLIFYENLKIWKENSEKWISRLLFYDLYYALQPKVQINSS
jgi:hypothetical protein